MNQKLSSRLPVCRVVVFVLAVVICLAEVVLAYNNTSDDDICPMEEPLPNDDCYDYLNGTDSLTCFYGEVSCCKEEGGPIQTFPIIECTCDLDSYSNDTWSCNNTDPCSSSPDYCGDNSTSDDDICPMEAPSPNDDCYDYLNGTDSLTCSYGEESCCKEEGGPILSFPSIQCTCDLDSYSNDTWSCDYSEECSSFPASCGNPGDDNSDDDICPIEAPSPNDDCSNYLSGTDSLTCPYGEEDCCKEEGGPILSFTSIKCECGLDDTSNLIWQCYNTEACFATPAYCEGSIDPIPFPILSLIFVIISFVCGSFLV